MLLVEGRKLLDAQVFNGRQKLLKLSLQTFFSMDFWEFCYLKLKNIRCSRSFCRKNDSQFDRKKELEAMREEREWFFVCCILDIGYSLNSIIHWMAWKHSAHIQWWSRFFNKGEMLAPSRLNILPTSYIEYKSVAWKKIITKVGCCYVIMLQRSGFFNRLYC